MNNNKISIKKVGLFLALIFILFTSSFYSLAEFNSSKGSGVEYEELKLDSIHSLYVCGSCREKVKHFNGFNILTTSNFVQLSTKDGKSMGNTAKCVVVIKGKKWLGLENELGELLIDEIDNDNFDFEFVKEGNCWDKEEGNDRNNCWKKYWVDRTMSLPSHVSPKIYDENQATRTNILSKLLKSFQADAGQDGYEYSFNKEGTTFRLYLSRDIKKAFRAVPWKELHVEIRNLETKKVYRYKFNSGIFPRPYIWENGGQANYGQCVWWAAKRWVEKVSTEKFFPFYPYQGDKEDMKGVTEITKAYQPKQYDILINYNPSIENLAARTEHYAFVEKVEKVKGDKVYKVHISQFNFISDQIYNHIERTWEKDKSTAKDLYYTKYNSSDSNKYYFKYYYRAGSSVQEAKEEPPKPEKEVTNHALAIIMDRSGSMSGEKIIREVNAAKALIADIPNDNYACLVTFAADAHTGVELCQATPKNKERLESVIGNVYASGNTNIGAGLYNGFQELNKGDNSFSHSALLMSDGMHNYGELWPAVEQYESRGWPVHTVAYGKDADINTLGNIASRTGGIFFLADTFNISQIYHRISAHVHNKSVLFAYNDKISQGKQLTYKIPIDPDISSATFFIDWQGSIVDLQLERPDGVMINPDNFHSFPGVDYQFGDTFSFYEVDEPIAGDWQVTLYGREIDQKSEQVNLTISGNSPLLANIFGLQSYYGRGEPIQIKVKVADLFSLEQESCSDFKVTAVIKKPSPNMKKMIQKGKIDLGELFLYGLTKKKKINLYDDGRHGDWNAGDGIYGALYKDTEEVGPYVITITCKAKKVDREEITRVLRESVQVGPMEDRTVTLADFLMVK